MENKDTEYIDGDADEFTIFLFSESPKEQNSIKLELSSAKKDIHIGLAVSVDEGLLVPVIPFTNQKDLPEIARISKQIAEKARQGSVNPNPVGTFTLSNMDMW